MSRGNELGKQRNVWGRVSHLGCRVLVAKGMVGSEALKVTKIIVNTSQHSWGAHYGAELFQSLYMDELMHSPHQRLETDYAITPYFTDENTETHKG